MKPAGVRIITLGNEMVFLEQIRGIIFFVKVFMAHGTLL